MWFRQCSFFRLGETPDAGVLEEALAGAPFGPCLGLDVFSDGFVAPVSHQHHHLPGDEGVVVTAPFGKMLGQHHPDAADDERPGDRRDGLGQLPAQHPHRQADQRRHEEGGDHLEGIVAVGRVAKAGDDRPDPLAKHQRDGQDRPGLHDDVEEVGTTWQPVLGDEQVTGAGNGQEFCEALDDA